MRLNATDMRQPTAALKLSHTHWMSKRIIGMRLIITLVGIGLVVGAVLGTGAVAERNARRALTRQLEVRLLAEARHLSVASAAPLLGDVPELTLHAMINEMHEAGADLAFAYVIDHEGVVQGHRDVAVLGTPYRNDLALVPYTSQVQSLSGETLVASATHIAAIVPVRHTDGRLIGRVIVGLDRLGIAQTVHAARRQLLLFLLPVLLGAVALTLLVMGRLLQPVSILRQAIERIAAGDLTTRVDVSSRTEFGILANSINEMASELDLAREQMREKSRLDVEMSLARDIQRSLLPKRSTVRGDFVVTGSQASAVEVGGDYYDILELDDTRIGLVIADVSGKGLAGCLVASMLAVLIRSFAPHMDSPTRLLLAVERGLSGSMQRGTFVTMFYGILDTETGVLTHASAAHNPLLQFHAADGTVTATKTSGLPIGASQSRLAESLRDESTAVAPGDMLLQTTDGINEATSDVAEEFGLDRLRDVLATAAPHGNHALMATLEAALDSWEPAPLRSDDRTILLIERMNSPHVETGALPVTMDLDESSLAARLWIARKQADSYLSLPARVDALELIGGWLRQCAGLAKQPQAIERAEQGLVELCANIAEHGYPNGTAERIEIWWLQENGHENGSDATKGHFLLLDRGCAFDLAALAAASDPKPGADGRGLGLNIIQSSFEDIVSKPGTPLGNLTVLGVAPGSPLASERKKPCLKHTELISFD